MGIFVSPKKIKAAMQADDTFIFEKRSEQWYLSPEGGQAYASANTLASKVLFFYKFLLSTVPIFQKENNSGDTACDEQKVGRWTAAQESKVPADDLALDDLEHDELFPAAVNIVMETGLCSVSLLQRRLNVGYARAARIVDEMEEHNIVGPFEGTKPRRLLITKEQWHAMQRGEQVSINPTGLQPEAIMSSDKSGADYNVNAMTLAWIFADAIAVSRLPYSTWPNILDQQKNSILKWLHQKHRTLGDLTAENLISVFREKQDSVLSLRSISDYQKLISYSTELEEAYLIEREFLFAFPCSMLLMNSHKTNMDSSEHAPDKAKIDLLADRMKSAHELVDHAAVILKETPTDTISGLKQISGQMTDKEKLESENKKLKKAFDDFEKDCNVTSVKNVMEIEDHATRVILQRGLPTVNPMYREKLRLSEERPTILSLQGFIPYLEEGNLWLQRANSINYAANRARFLSECKDLDEICQRTATAVNADKEAVLSNAKKTLDHFRNECAIIQTLVGKRINELSNALEAQTLLHQKYLFLADDIATILESGRAESFRDALNLAIEEDRLEKEEEARAEEARIRQEALEEQIRQEQESQLRMERIAREQAEEERRWHDEQQISAEKARQAAADDAKRAQWAADAETRRAASRSRDAYYSAKKAYDSAALLYRQAVNVHGVNSSDALRHKANMDKAMADMINSGYSG